MKPPPGQDWQSLILGIVLAAFFAYAVLATLATPGDPFDDSPNREPVQYPHH